MNIAAGVLAVFVALAGPRPQDPAVRMALKKFEDDFYRNGAKPDQKIQAIINLAIHKNEHVVKALTPVLTRDVSSSVRIVAARELARFASVPQAGQSVLAAFRSTANGGNKYSAVRIMLLRALGDLRMKDAAGDVERAVEDRNVWIAKAAIDAAGKIKSRNAVETMISALKRIEGPMGDAQVALNPLIDAFKEVTIGGMLGADGNDRPVSERDFLRQPLNEALRAITRANYTNTKEWDGWWKAHKATFEVRE